MIKCEISQEYDFAVDPNESLGYPGKDSAFSKEAYARQMETEIQKSNFVVICS